MKEVHEETGIECEVVQLIAVLDGLRLGFTRIPLYSLVFHCRAVGGDAPGPPARDRTDVGWFAEDALPEPIAGVDQWGDLAFAAIRGEPVDVLYDRPRNPPWRTENPDARRIRTESSRCRAREQQHRGGSHDEIGEMPRCSRPRPRSGWRATRRRRCSSGASPRSRPTTRRSTPSCTSTSTAPRAAAAEVDDRDRREAKIRARSPACRSG